MSPHHDPHAPDPLRQRWQTAHAHATAHLTLDRDALRQRLQDRAQGAFARHRRRLLAGLAFEAVLAAGLAAFLVAHAGQPVWLLLGGAFAVLLGLHAWIDLGQWRALGRLDLAAPVTAVNAALDRLQARRVRLEAGILLASVLLWYPLVLVLFKGLLGVDLLQHAHPALLAVNVGIGLVFIPLALLLARLLLPRSDGPGLRRFLADVAGASWSRARERIDDIDGFDSAGEDIADWQALPAPVADALHRLRRRLLLAAIAAGTGILALGLFNLAHGAQPTLLVPAIALILACVAHLATAIEHLKSVWIRAGGLPALAQRAQALHAQRLRLARITLIALPVLAVPLAAVLAQVLAGVDLVAWAGVGGTGFALGGAMLVSLIAAARLRRERTAAPWVGLASLGTVRATERLIVALQDTARRSTA